MVKGNNGAAIVILAILALGGFGMSGYMVVKDVILGGIEYVPDHDHDLIPHEHDMYKLVAVWEEPDGATSDDFNISLRENQLAPNNYFTLTNLDKSITLNQEGWYKFTFNTMWTGLTPTDYYYFGVYKNGMLDGYAVLLSNHPDTDYNIDEVYLVYSEGNATFNFRCYSGLGDIFSLITFYDFSRIYLEYVVTV